MAHERMKKAEVHAQDSQVELGKVRVENSELDKLNVSHGQDMCNLIRLTHFPRTG
jgi:hypothetical protein